MSTFAEHERRARAELANTLERLRDDDRAAAMAEACMETGGSLVPQGSGKWGPHYAEVKCLGVYHAGNDIAEAIANWIKAVRRMETGTTAEMVARAMCNTTGQAGAPA